MIRYLIKNNFKLMFRNKWNIAVMLVGPILVIAVVSSAFSELLKSYEDVDEFTVGYRVENVDDGMINVIKTAGEEAKIHFYEYPEGKIQEIMEKNELAGFVDISNKKYIVYTSDDHKTEGISLEYFMNKVMNTGIYASLEQEEQADIVLPVKQLEYMPAIDSVNYYGIVYIVYFCWCGMVCATGILSNEKKYGIARRYKVSNISETQNFIGKYIPCVLTVAVGMAAATAISILFYDIHWGNPLLSMCIVLLMIAAGTAMGIMFYNITDNIVITIILQFTVVWFMGFLGGCFESYMFSSTPDELKQLSPIYHVNRTLVELSCIGKSSYTVSAVIYSAAITVGCSLIAILAGYIRKRGKA